MVSGAVSGTFTWWLRHRMVRHPEQFPRMIWVWMTSAAGQLYWHIERLRSLQLEPGSVKTAHDFLQVVYMYQHQQVTDKRDKIYGLLGMANSCVMTIAVEVDYSRSYDAIIQDFVKDIIRQRGNLGVLAYVDSTAQDGNTPSWIPSWDLGLAKPPLNETVYYAGSFSFEEIERSSFPSGTLDINPLWFAKKDILELPGVIFDHVSEVSQEMKGVAYPDELRRYLDTNLVAKNWFKKMSIQQRKAAASAGLVDPTQEAVFELATTLTGGATSLEGGTAYSYLEQLHPMTEIGQLYLKQFWAFAKRRPDPERPEIDGNEFNFMAARACMTHRFIVTSKGHMGLARGGVRVGDVVAVLHGGYYPFILRRSKDTTDGYTLVGGMISRLWTAVYVLMCSRMLCLQSRQGRYERDASARRSRGNVVQTGMTLHLSKSKQTPCILGRYNV